MVDSADLPRIIGEKRPGNRVRIEIWRDGKAREVTATLDELTPEPTTTARRTGGEPADGKLGLNARMLTSQEASQLGVSNGIVVEGASGAAARAGLRRGDVMPGAGHRGRGGALRRRPAPARRPRFQPLPLAAVLRGLYDDGVILA